MVRYVLLFAIVILMACFSPAHAESSPAKTQKAKVTRAQFTGTWTGVLTNGSASCVIPAEGRTRIRVIIRGPSRSDRALVTKRAKPKFDVQAGTLSLGDWVLRLRDDGTLHVTVPTADQKRKVPADLILTRKPDPAGAPPQNPDRIKPDDHPVVAKSKLAGKWQGEIDEGKATVTIGRGGMTVTWKRTDPGAIYKSSGQFEFDVPNMTITQDGRTVVIKLLDNGDMHLRIDAKGRGRSLHIEGIVPRVRPPGEPAKEKRSG